MLDNVPIFQQTYWGNALGAYIVAACLFLAGLVFVKIVELFIVAKLRELSNKTANEIDDFLIKLVERTLVPLLYFSVLYVTFHRLNLSDTMASGLKFAWIAILTLQLTRLIVALSSYSVQQVCNRRAKETGKPTSFNALIMILRIIIWGIALVFFLDNMGFDVSAVVAGLGIGGVAVAFAAQSILGDLFNYFVIFLDRPFEEGDFIIVDSYMGGIEHVGIKTTRIRSLGGEQLIFSNSDLTSARIKNYKRMEKRRIVFKLGVTYQTTSQQMKLVPGIIKNIIDDIEATVFDRAHFFSFGAFSLDIEVVYYVLSSDYNRYMDIQQEINLKIKEKFEAEKIEFAYPTQTLFMENSGGSADAR